MNKKEVFKCEYTYIKNKKYVDNLKIMVDLLPDYFFIIPASSTGKYHPMYATGDGGLVRHTKAAVRLAHELLTNNTIGSVFSDDEKDMMIFSLVLHDGLKSGIVKEKYTRFDHPLLIAQFIKDNKDKLSLNEEEINFICKCVSTHMGEWTTDYNGNEVLKKPSNKYQKFVHMCDFLASKKFINVNFKDNEIVD